MKNLASQMGSKRLLSLKHCKVSERLIIIIIIIRLVGHWKRIYYKTTFVMDSVKLVIILLSLEKKRATDFGSVITKWGINVAVEIFCSIL